MTDRRPTTIHLSRSTLAVLVVLVAFVLASALTDDADVSAEVAAGTAALVKVLTLAVSMLGGDSGLLPPPDAAPSPPEPIEEVSP